MNDNLRYISLQYIKGDNYEEITCFNYEVMKEILDDEEGLRKYSKKALNDLYDVIEENKCKIGEGFLNDLVNYYNFKDIRKKLELAKKFISECKENLKIEKDKTNKSDLNNSNKDLVNKLKNLIKILRFLENANIGLQLFNETEYNENLNILLKKTKTKKTLQTYKNVIELVKKHRFKQEESNNILIEPFDNQNDKDEDEDKINMSDFISDIKQEKDFVNIKNKIIVQINKIISSSNGTKYDFIKLLTTLCNLLLLDTEQNNSEYLSSLKSYDDLLSLFKTYITICNRNINKYDNLFQQNDISNIDEAFMIVSYTKFLKKLKKLKENLETKDVNKLERALTSTLDKLFNLYGINAPEKLDLNTDKNSDQAKYFKDRILNNY
jgi:hypothetical protein